jgi:hypothetical protein
MVGYVSAMFENNTGILWFDDDPKTNLQDKVRRLIRHCKQKYGFYPNLCYIHKSAFSNEKVTRIDETEIRTQRSVLPNHFWIGSTKKRRKSQ